MRKRMCIGVYIMCNKSQEIYKRLPGAVGEGREVPKGLVSKRKEVDG